MHRHAVTVDRSGVRQEPSPAEIAPVIDQNILIEYPQDVFPPDDSFSVLARIPLSVTERAPEIDHNVVLLEGLDYVRPELATHEAFDEITIRRFCFHFTHRVDYGINEELSHDDALRDLHNIAEDHISHQIQTVLEAGCITEGLEGYRFDRKWTSGSSDKLTKEIRRFPIGDVVWTVDGIYVEPLESSDTTNDQRTHPQHE